MARCGWEQVGCLIFQKSLFFHCLRDVWETKSVAEDALGQEQQRDESRLLFGETTGWDMPFQTWKFPFVSTFLYFVVFLMVIWIFPFCLSRVWQCNPKGRAVSLLWKNKYICLREFIGGTGTERNGGAKRATGCRSTGRLVRASARTPCGVLNSAFRKVFEYSAGSTRILCGRYCGRLRMGGRGETVRPAGHCGVRDAGCGISECVFLPMNLSRDASNLIFIVQVGAGRLLVPAFLCAPPVLARSPILFSFAWSLFSFAAGANRPRRACRDSVLGRKRCVLESGQNIADVVAHGCAHCGERPLGRSCGKGALAGFFSPVGDDRAPFLCRQNAGYSLSCLTFSFRPCAGQCLFAYKVSWNAVEWFQLIRCTSAKYGCIFLRPSAGREIRDSRAVRMTFCQTDILILHRRLAGLRTRGCSGNNLCRIGQLNF